MKHKVNITEFKNFIEFFQVKSMFFIELSIKENWFRLYLTNTFKKEFECFKDLQKYPLERFRDILHESSIVDFDTFIINASELEAGTRFDLELRIKGDIEWVKAILIPGEDRVFTGFVQDIGGRKTSEMQIKNKQDQQNFILENITEVIKQYDASGNLIFANDAYKKMFNHAIEGEYTIHSDGYDTKWFDDLLNEPYYSQSVAYYDIDGKQTYLQWYNQAILVDGKVDRVICVGVDVTELQKSRQRLVYELNHDERTGFLNKRGLQLVFEELSEGSFDTYYIHTSNINYIQDLYGFQVAEKLLGQVVKSLRELQGFGYHVGHIKNDEYVVVNETKNSSRSKIEKRLLKYLNSTVNVDGIHFYTTTDIGLVAYPEDTIDTDVILPYGNLAMNHARQSKAVSIVRFKDELYAKSRFDLETVNDLRLAMDNEEIELYYQDIINIEDNTVSYVETLARWKHPTKGMIAPPVFFGLAQQSNLGYELDFTVLKKSFTNFEQMKKLPRYQNTILSANVTPKTFLYPDFVENVIGLLDLVGLEPSEVCIEINENTFVSRESECIAQIDEMKKHGLVVALDDFGSKYSSLSVINKMNFDVIKIDKIFVDTLDQDSTVTILQMMNQLAIDLKRDVIIEGVETEAQRDTLKELGYRFIQGYLYSIPREIKI